MSTGPKYASPSQIRLIEGTLADLTSANFIYKKHQFIHVTDYPNLLFRGDNVTPFSQLVQANSVKTGVLNAINATATATAAQVAGGVITSTSAAATTITLPTATLLAAAVGGKRGVTVDFTVDNSAGANTVTVAVGTGITVATAVLTGADTLTVAAGKVGIFRIYFTSATAAQLYRIG